MNKKRFLVCLSDDEGNMYLSTRTASEVFDMLDYEDCNECYTLNYVLYCQEDNYYPVLLWGKWHSEDPQYMKITRKDTGETLFSYYGTEH